MVVFPAPPPAGTWITDRILGDGFSARTLPLLDDDEGPAQATLVRHEPDNDPGFTHEGPHLARFVMLYLHGWNDYFYQAHFAREIAGAGGAFYGLDLRKYGRSLREGLTRGYTQSLRTYDEDIHEALAVIGEDYGPGVPLVLGGHSTGGLTACLWAHRHPDAIRALVLNSPWLELQGSSILRLISGPLVSTMAWTQPKSPLPMGDAGFYSRAQRGWTTADGPLPAGAQPDDPFYAGWNIDPALRTTPSAPVRPGWLAAILEGHAAVAAGLDIGCPVWVGHSGESLFASSWDPRMRYTDTVLDVEQIRQYSVRLGRHVTVAAFEGALHDLTLSAPDVRARVFEEITRWLNAYL